MEWNPTKKQIQYIDYLIKKSQYRKELMDELLYHANIYRIDVSKNKLLKNKSNGG